MTFPPSQIKHVDRRDRAKAATGGKNFGQGSAPSANSPRFDFSYSGIKTAVLRYVETHAMRDSIEARRRQLAVITKPTLDDYLSLCDRETLNLVASFQRAMINDLVTKTLAAAQAYDIATLFVTGGVAANNELRQTFEREAAQQGLPVFFPSRPLSTDNAAMIAAAAFPKFLTNDFAPMDFSAESSLALRGVVL